jgi:nitrous oxidase accessory protein NosD
MLVQVLRLASLLAMIAAASCERTTTSIALGRRQATAVLFVSNAAPAGGAADGSAAQPFATLREALAAAPPGALLRISEGEFREQLVIARPVVLLGQGQGRTRIISGPNGVAVEVRAERVELRELSIEGGETSLAFHRGERHRLVNLELHGASQTGLFGRNARLVFNGGSIHDIGGSQPGRGIDLDGGGIEAREIVFRAAGRRAVVLHGARGVLEDLDVRGSSLAAVQATGGADVRVVRGVFESLSGAALYAGASRLQVEDAHVRRAEYGVIGFGKATVVVRGGEFTDYRVAGVALVSSHGSVSDAAFARGGSEGAISITDADGDVPVLVSDNRIRQPGPMGLHVTGSAVTVRGNSITGARLDRDNDLGDALYAIHAQLVVENNVLRGNAGSGVAAVRSNVLFTGNVFIENRRAGVLLLDRSKGTAGGNLFTRNSLAGIELGEGSRASLSRNRFRDNPRYDVDSGCGPGAGSASLDVEVEQRTCPP